MKTVVYGALAVIAFASFGFIESKARAASPAMHAMNEKKAAAGGTMHQADFKNAMRKLWEDHIEYTRNYIISALGNLEDTPKIADRLLRNQDDIGNAVKPIYGEARRQYGDELLALAGAAETSSVPSLACGGQGGSGLGADR